MKVIVKALLLVLILLTFPSVILDAQQSVTPKRIFILDWYDKDYFWNVKFGATFQTALQSVQTVEIYTEYLESNRFPGTEQALALRDYLKRKYAGRPIDVVIADSDASLDFLLKYRDELFPQAPIVFVATKPPSKEAMVVGPGLTGIIVLDTYKETLDLALKFHPVTQQLFVVSGTLEHDKRIEMLARNELQSYESRLIITYLTDLSLEELVATTKSLPERSIVFFAWQQAQTKQGNVLESAEIIDSFARSATVPVYGMSFHRKWLQADYLSDGSGIVGGYVNTSDASANKAAEIVLRILNGAHAQDIPVERAPPVLMLNWRQLKRWGISEDSVPVGSVVRFKDQSTWDLYKHYIVGAVALIVLQTALVGGLLLQRSRRTRAERSRRISEQNLQKLSGRLIRLQDDEQRRIARELHDGLGQSLSMISNRATLCMEDTAEAPVRQQLEEISAIAVSTINEIREIAHDLRPFELDRLGLVAAVDSMLDRVSEATEIDLSSDLDHIDGLLSPAAETSVYRIVQEGLNNVVKHSHATEASVGIKRINSEIVVSIQDNGRGFNLQNGSGNGDSLSGFGLQGISERVRMLGAAFSLDSKPGTGTTIKVRLKVSSS